MSIHNIKNKNHNRKFINIVNTSIRKNRNIPIRLVTSNMEIQRVDYAFPYTSSQVDINYPSYTDTILENKTTRSLNLSVENSSVEFELKTGIKGINIVIPSILDRMMFIMKSNIDSTTTTAIRLSNQNKKKVMTGISALGGKLDYYFQDSEELTNTYEEGVLTFNKGSLLTPDEFSENIDIYLIIVGDDKYIMEEMKNFRYESVKKNIQVTTVLPENITNIVEIN